MAPDVLHVIPTGIKVFAADLATVLFDPQMNAFPVVRQGRVRLEFQTAFRAEVPFDPVAVLVHLVDPEGRRTRKPHLADVALEGPFT